MVRTKWLIGLIDLHCGHYTRALTKLTDDYRDVILLRYIEELSIQDSADILDKTPGAIKGLQHRALRALHNLMHPFANQDLSKESVS